MNTFEDLYTWLSFVTQVGSFALFICICLEFPFLYTSQYLK
jgi:hypothetical protein